jgi:Spy/CpxP family protein refolding chaperone
MKTKRILASAMILIMIFSGMQLMAQERTKENKREAYKYLELSADQQTKAEAMKIDVQNQIKPMSLDAKEKQVQLEKLMIADKPDEGAIFDKIDEISKIKTEIQKLRISNTLKFRAMLTPEQKAKFDVMEKNKRNRKDRSQHTKGKMRKSKK